MTPQPIPTEAQVLDWMTSLSNWGRWGGDDQLGCLNLIAPTKRRQAAALVQEGEIVSCARPITTETAPDIGYLGFGFDVHIAVLFDERIYL